MAAKKLTAAQKKKLADAAAKKKKAAAAAAKAKAAAALAKKNAENDKYKPANYLRGDKNPGKSYTAWNTYGQGTPDLGKKQGPGDPYHEVQAKIPTRGKAIIDRVKRLGDEASARETANYNKTREPQTTNPGQSTGQVKPPTQITKPISKPIYGNAKPRLDFRSQAIRNRLSVVK